jgi:hypothetical protein
MLENSTPRSELSKEDNVGIYMQMVLWWNFKELLGLHT